MLKGRRIEVAGGGVAGLAVARATALRGAEVRLSERAAAFSDRGAGLQISPNGLRVIDALGLGDALRDVSLRAHGVVLRDRHGRRVLRMPFRQEYRLIHRPRLIEVLAEGARRAGADLQMGLDVRDAAPGALTLAADGIGSRHRARLDGPGAARFTGQVAWRTIVPDDGPCDGSGVAEVFMGPGRHLVSYPLAGGLRNIVAVEERAAWTAEGWAHQDDPDTLRAAFAGFGGPVPDWLARVSDVAVWGLHLHPVAEVWHGPGVALLGDAAHPMLPFLAQGANMALEDAWVLADRLDGMPEPAALSAYQAARADRTRRVAAAAAANARNYHHRGLRAGIGHAALRLLDGAAPGLLLRRYDWLYRHDVTAQFPV